jgi:hypothetical protein
VTGAAELVREIDDAVARQGWEALSKRMHSDVVIVAPYAQRLELQDGLLVRGAMVQGAEHGVP